MQSVQQDTPLMSALRAVLTLLGSLLIGHVVISGHPLTTDLWQLILGSAMTIVGAVTEYTSTTTSPTQMQSLATSAGAALGGVLLALGIVKQENWQSFMGVISAILPLIHKQSTKQVAMHITNNKLTYDKALGTIRKVAVIIFLLGAGTVAHAQQGCPTLNPGDSVKYAQVWNWSIGELKESAKQSYFHVLDVMHQKVGFTKEGFEKALDQYEYWRTVVDLKLTNKKDRDDFHNWIASQAKIAGKLTYKEDDKPEQPSTNTAQYSYISSITPITTNEVNAFNYTYSSGLELPSYSGGRRQKYSTGFKLFFKHKADPTHLHLMSGKMGDPPSGTDTTTWQGFEPVASVILYAYSPTLKTWSSLGGIGIAYSKYVWKTSSTGTGYWYCQFSIAGLGYAGGSLGSKPAAPTSLTGVGAIGASISLFNKYLSLGGGYDVINKGGLITVGSNFSIFN